MPTKRRKLTPTKIAITDRALEAWRQGDFHTLNREIGCGPHLVSPFDVEGPDPPSWVRGTSLTLGFYGRWRETWGLRQRLIELAGPPGRYDRHGVPLGPRHGNQA